KISNLKSQIPNLKSQIPNLILFLCIASSAQAAADFTLHPDQSAGPPIVGFGAEMNPYLYCKPNDLDEASSKEYERQVLALAPQHVRIFCLLKWFDGGTDPISKGDPRTAESFLKSCDLAQRAGATINLTLWYGPWPDPDASMKRFAELLADWINNRKLTAIQYITIQNEVNDTEKITIEKYAALYRALDKHLKALNLRDKLKIVSGDLVQTDQDQWFHDIAQSIGDISD